MTRTRTTANRYMDEYMGDFIFDTCQPFHFFVAEEIDYRIPTETDEEAAAAATPDKPDKPDKQKEKEKAEKEKAEKQKENGDKNAQNQNHARKELYTNFIETLPLENTPEVFGLHPNAEIGYYTSAAKAMWANLVELQPQTGMSMQLLAPLASLASLAFAPFMLNAQCSMHNA